MASGAHSQDFEGVNPACWRELAIICGDWVGGHLGLSVPSHTMPPRRNHPCKLVGLGLSESSSAVGGFAGMTKIYPRERKPRSSGRGYKRLGSAARFSPKSGRLLTISQSKPC